MIANGVIMWTFLVTLFAPATALDNGLALTPQMGWNSWNHFNCDINATVIKGAADAIIANGLDKLGYNYVNIDDCWALLERGSDGTIVPDPAKFPDGIVGLAEEIHAMGLKLGIYSDAGTKTCGGQPGSLGYEYVDAASFASWGIDYLKYDNCFNEDIPAPVRYPPMHDALNKTGRPILYSLCEWGRDNVTDWAGPISNSWRTTGDIKDAWLSMKANYLKNAKHADKAGPGRWNDPDMLEVGNSGMSNVEYQTHFALWAIAKSPLILGNDLTKLDNETYAIIANPEVIAINQDSLGVQATCKLACAVVETWLGLRIQVWTGSLANGDTVVALVNWSLFEIFNYSLSFKDIGLTGEYAVRDLWARNDLADSVEALEFGSIKGHGNVLLRLTPK